MKSMISALSDDSESRDLYIKLLKKNIRFSVLMGIGIGLASSNLFNTAFFGIIGGIFHNFISLCLTGGFGAISLISIILMSIGIHVSCKSRIKIYELITNYNNKKTGHSSTGPGIIRQNNNVRKIETPQLDIIPARKSSHASLVIIKFLFHPTNGKTNDGNIVIKEYIENGNPVKKSGNCFFALFAFFSLYSFTISSYGSNAEIN